MNAGVMPTLFSPQWMIVSDPSRHLFCCLVKCKKPYSPTILARSLKVLKIRTKISIQYENIYVTIEQHDIAKQSLFFMAWLRMEKYKMNKVLNKNKYLLVNL